MILTVTFKIVAAVSHPEDLKKASTRRTEESDCFPTVEQTVVVRQRDDHDRADNDLAIDDDRAILDRMHTWSYGMVSATGSTSQHKNAIEIEGV